MHGLWLVQGQPELEREVGIVCVCEGKVSCGGGFEKGGHVLL